MNEKVEELRRRVAQCNVTPTSKTILEILNLLDVIIDLIVELRVKGTK